MLEKRFLEAAKALEQTKPYLNRRPIKMRGLIPGETCLDFLVRKIPSRDRAYWEEATRSARICHQNGPVGPDDILRSGDILYHELMEAPEPPINANIKIIHEDDQMLVLDKPAPLPVHPCGRYKFHTLTEIAKRAWPELNLHLVHRLDAETTGILILAKTPEAARALTEQFTDRSVQKEYLALVEGVPSWDQLKCETPIISRRYPTGQSALTVLSCLQRFENRALVLAKPVTGRTNQIRIHLRNLGHPVLHLHASKLEISSRTFEATFFFSPREP
ncbi:MAG: pseudouridine synthase [Myxococcota bacterium]